MHKVYATGLRNPTALDIQPGTGVLWALVNERDEIGPNLAPDYLTSVQEGGFYGWPYSYWGQHVDTRVMPFDPATVDPAITRVHLRRPHLAALALSSSLRARRRACSEGGVAGRSERLQTDTPINTQ